MPEALGRILPLLIEVQQKETGLEYIETVLRYLTSGAEKITEAELTEILKDVYVEGEKLMPTIAQEWIEQGKAIGKKQGRQEGQQEGRQEGCQAMLETLYQILIIRFEIVLGDFDEHFELLDLKALKELSEVALTVQTLAEFKNTLAEIVSKVNPTSPYPDNGEEQEK